MVESCAFIFLGSDESRKQERLALLQKDFFPPHLKDFNYTLLYADDKQCTPFVLKEALVCFPTAGAKKRLVVIKMAHKLNKALQSCLFQELGRLQDKTVVVLDIPEVKETEDLVRSCVTAGFEVVRFKNEVAPNVFDLGRAIIDRKPEGALGVLSGLLQYREKSEKIIGALFWQWDRFYSDKRLSQDQYSKGLKLIVDADRRLKSSVSAYARENLILEALVVKLAYLPR